MLHPNMPVYLRDVRFSTEKKDGETRKIVQCGIVIAPFTSAMAEELGPGIREHVFKRADGEPLDQLAEVKFKLNVPLQQVRIKLAPDLPGDTIQIENVRIDPELKLRRDKETPTIEATLWMDFPYPTPEILMFLANQQNEQILVSFYDTQGDLLADDAKTAKPQLVSGRRRKGGDESAPAAEPAGAVAE